MLQILRLQVFRLGGLSFQLINCAAALQETSWEKPE